MLGIVWNKSYKSVLGGTVSMQDCSQSNTLFGKFQVPKVPSSKMKTG
jgi:hypothetical protein